MPARWRAATIASLATLLACCGAETGPANEPGRNAPSVVRVAGELQSASTRNFGAPSIPDIWQFTIAYMAPEGSRVATGEEVLRFNSQELETRLQTKENARNEKEKELRKQQIVARERRAELRLAIEEARADLDKAALKADIPETLLAGRDFRENQLLLRQARLTVAQREAALEKESALLDTEDRIRRQEIKVLSEEIADLRQSIEAMTIRAPGEGVVLHSLDRRGNKMAVGDNVWGGRRVIQLSDLARLELRLEIEERDSARVAIGESVAYTLDAAPDRVFRGRITELASVVHTRSANQPAKVIDALVALSDPDPELMRPGMSVNAEIPLSTPSKAAP